MGEASEQTIQIINVVWRGRLMGAPENIDE
jgi:hypothetical protein